jgi:hypothetical protein
VIVYVDDIIVSCNDGEEVREGLLSIRSAATESHFPTNEAKSKGPLRSLHAFDIELRDGELEILADRFDEMCGVVLQTGPGPSSAGILSYVQSISQAQADELLEAFPQAFPRALNSCSIIGGERSGSLDQPDGGQRDATMRREGGRSPATSSSSLERIAEANEV